MMEKSYIDTIRLLLESAPALFETPAFALKGGTAINLFVDDMPRLSVDLDLVFTDYKLQRTEALKAITAGLEASLNRLTRLGLDAELAFTHNGN